MLDYLGCTWDVIISSTPNFLHLLQHMGRINSQLRCYLINCRCTLCDKLYRQCRHSLDKTPSTELHNPEWELHQRSCKKFILILCVSAYVDCAEDLEWYLMVPLTSIVLSASVNVDREEDLDWCLMAPLISFICTQVLTDIWQKLLVVETCFAILLQHCWQQCCLLQLNLA